MKKSKSGTRQKSNTNLVKKKHIFLHVYFFFQWYILDDVSPLSIQLATEKQSNTCISDKITYVQHYNMESIHLYYFGIQSDNDHIIHKKSSL